MADSEDRWIPTSHDVTGSETASENTKSDVGGLKRLLRSFTRRRGVGTKRNESPSPAPDLQKAAPDAPSEVTPQMVDPDVVVSRSRTGKPFITPQRVRRSHKSDPMPETSMPKSGVWWPDNSTLSQVLEKAEAKGHRFTGVETEPNGSRIWRCDNCGQRVQHVFEQDERWPDGIGTWIIKNDAAGFKCC